MSPRELASMTEKNFISKRVIAYEAAAFACIIVLVWLDEIIDIPALLLGAEKTPVNWRESLFESIVIALVAAGAMQLTSNLFRRIKYLEGMLPICAACKRIRREHGDWQPLETYIREQSDAKFTHGICPDCAERLYPECNPYNKNKSAAA